jgi:hypothetical protein
LSLLDPDNLLDYLYEEINAFLVKEAGEELGNYEIDISLESDKKGQTNIEISLELELVAYSKINVEKLTNRAIAYGGEIADKYCPSLAKLNISKREV